MEVYLRHVRNCYMSIPTHIDKNCRRLEYSLIYLLNYIQDRSFLTLIMTRHSCDCFDHMLDRVYIFTLFSTCFWYCGFVTHLTGIGMCMCCAWFHTRRYHSHTHVKGTLIPLIEKSIFKTKVWCLRLESNGRIRTESCGFFGCEGNVWRVCINVSWIKKRHTKTICNRSAAEV